MAVKIPKKIPVNVKYIIATDVEFSLEELTDSQILKLSKTQLQSALAATRILLITSRKNFKELEILAKKNIRNTTPIVI